MMIKFELKKLFNQKKFWVIIAISSALVLYSFIFTNELGSNRGNYTNLESKYLKYTTKFFDYIQVNLYENNEQNTELEKDGIVLKNILNRISILLKGDNTGWYKKNYNEYIKDYKKIIDDQVYLRDKYNLNSKQYDTIQSSEIDDNAITWLNKEFKYINENNVKSTTHGEEFSENFGKALIYNFSLIFGLPALILFAFIFSSSMALEYEDESNLFLYTQPIKKLKIILSKILSNFIYVVFYFLISLVFMYLTYCVYGNYEFDGFDEIYRIFSENDIYMHMTFKELLPKLMFAFFSTSLFIITLTNMIGVIVKNQVKTIGIMIGTVFILRFLQNQLAIFGTIYNPIYLFDYLNVLKGNIGFVVNGTQKGIDYLYSKSIFVYFIPIVYSIIALILSSILVNVEEAGKYRESKRNFRDIKPSKFEYIKILENKSFYTLSILSISILVFLFTGFLNLNNQKRLSDDTEIKIERSKEIIKKQEKIIEDLERKKSRAIDKGETNLREYDVKLELYKKTLKGMKYFYKGDLNKIEAIKNNDSRKYYENILKDTNYIFGKDDSSRISTMFSYIKNEIHSEMSYKEITHLYKYAIDNNVDVFKSSEVLTSEFEEFVSQQVKSLVKKEQFPLSNSGFQTLQYFNNTDNISYVILILAMIITIGGYTFDKEKGNQLELMYTQPVKKIRYFINKLISMSTLSILIVFIGYLILFVFGLLTEGIGSYNYPIIKYLEYIKISTRDYFEIIPLWNYLASIFTIFIFAIVFLSNYAILISNFVKRKSTLFFVTIGSAILLNYVFTIFSDGNLVVFSPFSYLNPAEIANGKFVISNKLSQFNQLYPFMVLGISSIILFSINIIVSKNKR